MAEQILAIVQIDKEMAGIGLDSNGSEHGPNGSDKSQDITEFNELTEIRENHDLWHYSPVMGHQPVPSPNGTVNGQNVHFSPPGLPMPAPFAGSPDGFHGVHAAGQGQHGHTLPTHQEQIQNAYALTPKMPAMEAQVNPYVHATPKVVYEDQNAMLMMVEELDIEEPAQPIAIPPIPKSQNVSNHSRTRSVNHNVSNVMMHSFDRNRSASYDHNRTISPYDRRPYDHYDEYVPYSSNHFHRDDSNLSNHGHAQQYPQPHPHPRHGGHGRIPRHRPEAIRENDIPPRFRKRKAPRERCAAPFQSRRAKVHSMRLDKVHSTQMSHSNGPQGPWYKDPAVDLRNNEHTSIHALMRRYSNHHQ